MAQRPQSKSGRTGAAGRQGDDARSDLRVEIALTDRDGLTLDLDSRVAAYYGESIRAQVRGLVAACGVEHARISVQDRGGLPFVIAARVEAALRRAGVGDGDGRPPREVPLPEPTRRDRLRRSRLYLPGNEPKFMINAGLHGADGVILDLEDSVHADEKDAARLVVRNALRCVDFGGCERMVRINPLPLGFEDIAAIAPESPDLILIPKVETPDEVREIDEQVSQASAAGRPVWLMPILETALGIERAYEIAAASANVVALTLGLEDYTADLGVPKTPGGDETRYARMRVVNAACAAGVQPIDSVYGDVGDTAGLQTWATRSRAMGFGGMGCVHPRQIEVIHSAFAPSPEELARARRIVAAFDQARDAGLGVVSLGSKMIDAPVVERARKLVERARQAGLIPEEDA